MANNAIVGVLRALLTLDTAQFESGMRKASDSAKAFTKSTRQIGLQATQIGSQLTRTLTLPILGFGAAVAKAAIDFESSFAGVRKTVNATEAEFTVMANSLRQLSREIPINVNELNRLAESAGALGIPKDQIVEFSRVMAELGVTTNVTSDQAAESIGQIQTIFQASGKDTERFASTLVDLGNKGASTEHQILELANRIASAGRAVGMSQAEVLGFSSAIANVGIEAEAGGTAISKVFSDMSIAASHGGEDIAAFAEIAGKSTDEFVKLFKEDAASAVVSFIEGLGKSAKAGGDLNLILEDLGFKEVRQARALRDLALSGQNLATSLRTANSAWKDNTALSEEARKRFETTASQLTLLWNRVKDVAITLGNALLPLIKSMVSALDKVVPMLESAANAFAKMPIPVQAVVVALGLSVAAVGPLLFVFGQLVLSASAVAGAFTKTGIATRALNVLMSGGLVTSAKAAGTAFAGSAVAVGVFTAALAGIVVPLALIKVAELIQQINALIKERGERQAGIVGENATHLRMMAEASRVAGREIKNYDEALSILRTRITLLQLGAFKEQQQGAAAATTKLTTSAQTLTAKLAEANRILNSLTGAMRAELQAGITLGQSNKELETSFNKLFPKVKLSEEMIGLFRDRLSGAGSAAKKAAKDFDELTGATARADAMQLAAQLSSGVIRLSGLTVEAQRQVAKTLEEGVESWNALGQAVPASVARQLSAVTQLRTIPDILKEMNKEVHETAVEQSRRATQEFLNNQREQAERGSAATLDTLRGMVQARSEAHKEALEMSFRQAEFAIEQAKREGAGWQQVAAMESQLSRARLEAAIQDADAEFEARAAAIDRTTALGEMAYQALAGQHKAIVDRMVEDWRLGEIAKRDELNRTHNIWLQTWGKIKGELSQIKEDLTGHLFTFLFGGDDGEAKKRAQEAREDYERIAKSGKASAEEITRAFRAMRQAESEAHSKWADRFKSMWDGIKKHLFNIFDEILGAFVNNLLKVMLKHLAATKLGNKLLGFLGLGGGEGGGGGLLGTGISAAGSALGIGGSAASVGTLAGAPITGATGAAIGTVSATGGTVAAGSAAAAGTGAGAGAGAAGGTAAGGGALATLAAAAPFIAVGVGAIWGLKVGSEDSRLGKLVIDAWKRRADKFVDPVTGTVHATPARLGRMTRGWFDPRYDRETGLRKFHTGGIVGEDVQSGDVRRMGLRSNEVLIKALKGEAVLTPEATKSIGGKPIIDLLNAGSFGSVMSQWMRQFAPSHSETTPFQARSLMPSMPSPNQNIFDRLAAARTVQPSGPGAQISRAPTLIQNINITGSVADKRVWREAFDTHIIPMQKEALATNGGGLRTSVRDAANK